MRRCVKLVLAYDGAAFQGWQRQSAGRTVQGVMEDAVRAVTKEAAPVAGSGRTDAGVHACGQVCSFETDCRLAPETLVRALNANLPEDVAVRAASDQPSGFHARFSVRRKTYVYRAYVAPERDPLRRRALHLRDVPDLAAMREAARFLVGRHDFRSFATSVPPEKSTIRTLMALRVLQARDELRFFATADGFLRHMVRALVGQLLRVGSGKDTPREAARILATADRAVGPAAAPGHGLVLWRVDY